MEKDTLEEYKVLVETLLRIQELEITLSEADILRQGNDAQRHQDLEAIKNEIRTLRSTLDEDVMIKYKRMRNNNSMAAVPVLAGRCAGCRVSLPVGDLNRMKVGKMPPVCHTCGRYLYIW